MSVLRQQRRVLGWALVAVNVVGALLFLRISLIFHMNVGLSGATDSLLTILGLLWFAAAIVAGSALVGGTAWSWPWVVCWAVATLAQALGTLGRGLAGELALALSDWWHGIDDLNYAGPQALTIIASWIVAVAIVHTVASQTRPPGVETAPSGTWVVCAIGASLIMLGRALL